MVLQIYTDASTKKSDGWATSILSTDRDFLGIIVKQYKVESPSHTEMYGVLQALEHVSESGMLYEAIDIYTDHESIVSIYNDYLENGVIKEVSYRYLFFKIVALCKNKNVKLYHMDSHQVVHNPNKTCDIMSNIARKHQVACGTVM